MVFSSLPVAYCLVPAFPCLNASSSPIEARSPCASRALAASSTSRPLRFIRRPTANLCTSNTPTTPIRSDPAPSIQSYLSIDRIIEVCKKSRAEAVHPGYGFLAENAAFAQRCKDEGIVFIGPSPQVIDQMGDKVKARQIMKGAGVPVVPGSDGILTSEEEVLKTIESIGYPCMLKAVAGGGGKGLRLVRSTSRGIIRVSRGGL